jgi:hypothetical protein
MSELSEIVAQLSEGWDIELELGLTPKQIDWYLKGLWFQLTEEAYEFYQLCDGIESEDFYVLSLGAATDTYRKWIKDWGYESDLLPLAASDDRFYAVQVDEEKYADSPIYEVIYDTDPENAQVAYGSLKEMLVKHCSVDM